MKTKWIYWIGLPTCFVCLVALTFLIPKTYQSQFIIVRESEPIHAMTINRPENYDLGVERTDNVFNVHSYKELVTSDSFLKELMNVTVCTIDGQWKGSYADYIRHQNHSKLIACYSLKKKDLNTCNQMDVTWSSKEEESIKFNLQKVIDMEVDYETGFLSVRFVSRDPLVSTMMAQAIHDRLLTAIEQYQQGKMQLTLQQLKHITDQAKEDYQNATSPEEKVVKRTIYESFARQEVIYKAQMIYHPAFVTIAEPSFSYKKVAPKRFTIPFIITLLLGCCLFGWEKREFIKTYLLQ